MFFFGYSGAIFERSRSPFHCLQRRKIRLPCTADLERRDYLDFLPKRPQGTTKILGTPAFAGTKTPAVLKFSSKGATTDCVETPVNCPHCGQKRPGRTSVPTPAVYPAFFFVLEKGSKSARNAAIPTYPMHRSHGLQGFLKRCYTPLPYFHQWVPHGKKTLVAIACKTAHIRFCG